MTTKAAFTGGNLFFRDTLLSPAKGASLWETCPLLAAFCDPRVAHVFYDDFHRLDKSADGWVLTQATSGTAVAGVLAGGVATLGAGATTDGQGPQIQLAGVDFFPAAGKHTWYETRVKVNVLTSDLFIGLAALDTTLIGTTDMTAQDFIGFKSFTGDGVLVGVGDKATAGGSVAAVKTLVVDTYVHLGFYINGVTDVTLYVDGVAKATKIATANVPIVGLTPSFAVHATGTGTPALDVDWIKVAQLR